ncbi:uncharacterized protein TRAVEDRAFT_51571 [Trametes versicolor FP-101664 SS1]|uniref:uncharacterized protein n=1 Tax=Trametes versicolor (strain FP-101664) TaxID=717944 RepID=UPI0004621CDB|nr:uncharacterized protein TRAVEDRAFT_51571 [Trametes versicolor FP-101664 SS1]EIW53831.1 hypothetical protein TRAVEDRAFT_51571 [Trametes versicolor FP-101664 SS1]
MSSPRPQRRRNKSGDIGRLGYISPMAIPLSDASSPAPLSPPSRHPSNTCRRWDWSPSHLWLHCAFRKELGDEVRMSRSSYFRGRSGNVCWRFLLLRRCVKKRRALQALAGKSYLGFQACSREWSSVTSAVASPLLLVLLALAVHAVVAVVIADTTIPDKKNNSTLDDRCWENISRRAASERVSEV